MTDHSDKADDGSVDRRTRRARRAALGLAVAGGLILAWGGTPARASAIYGTLSNFDIYNTTPEPAEGAEIELEDIDPSCVGGDYPAHFANKTIEAYVNANGKTCTRIKYTDYNFSGAPTPGSLIPNPNPVSTNGHALTFTAGGEHFGFWLTNRQPTATRFYWLNNNGGTYERINTMPESVPGPTWNYVPPAVPGNPPVLQAVIKVPEPPEVINQRPDSIWMKIFKTKLEAKPGNLQDFLEDLISGDPNDPNYANIVPQSEVETETEWELLDGGKQPKERVKEDEISDKDKVVIRRYEFYKYIGPVNEENEPISNWNEVGDPADIGERGDFISSNMVAAIIVAHPNRFDYNADGDVDADDLAAFLSCATGPQIAGPPSDECFPERYTDSDADGDNDVDQLDFGMFQRCFSGAGKPTDPACLQ